MVRVVSTQRPNVSSFVSDSNSTCEVELSSRERQQISIHPSQAESVPEAEPVVIGTQYSSVSHDRTEDGAQILHSVASFDEDVQNEAAVTADTDAACAKVKTPSMSEPPQNLVDTEPERNTSGATVAGMLATFSIQKVLRLFGALAVSALTVTWLISAGSPISKPEIDETQELPRNERGAGAVSTDVDVNQELAPMDPLTLQSNETAGQHRPESPEAERTTSFAPVILDKRVIERDFQGSLTVQIASLLSRESAERVLAEAKARTGLQGVVYPPIGQEAQWYVIYLGSFTSVETAEEAIQPLFVEQLVTEVLVKPVPRGYEPQLAGELK
jgi:septal ring-binding cell division protein DamX